MAEITLDLSKVPLGEIRMANLEGIRRYARYVEGQRAYGAAGVLRHIADQIEAQTKPPRIPEPGRYGVVKAAAIAVFTANTGVVDWVNEGKFWRSIDSGSTRRWEDLIDPVLIRPGVDD